MDITLARQKGLTAYNRWLTYNGVTLLTPVEGNKVWMLDLRGEVCHSWTLEQEAAWGAELLPSGHLLVPLRDDAGPLGGLDGSAGRMVELDWDGNKVWEHADPFMHHAAYRRENGNTLILRWVKLPDGVAEAVRAGMSETAAAQDDLWGDAIQEITPDGEVAWEWIAHEHLDPKTEFPCPICSLNTWPHANSIALMPDGDLAVCFMGINTLAIIDRQSGDVTWKWGQDRDGLAHPHSCSVLDNGNLLVFDNGYHPRIFPSGFSRILEVQPESSKMTWAYMGVERMPHSFFSAVYSSCQRLPNANTLICEGTTGRVFEITAKGELVWEYVNDLPAQQSKPRRSLPVYTAWRYGFDYTGLKRPIQLSTDRQTAPGTPLQSGEGDVIRSRLDALGY